MTDIVEKLRWRVENTYGSPTATTSMLCAEAADEITRLRNELYIAQEWSARVIAGREQDIAETTALRAENEKLRAALQRVDDDHGYGLPPDTRSMIRAALEEKR